MPGILLNPMWCASLLFDPHGPDLFKEIRFHFHCSALAENADLDNETGATVPLDNGAFQTL